MPGASYANQKARREISAGAVERRYDEMRRALERHLERLPPQNGRFVAAITSEERLCEALAQRATVQQVLDVMEQRWPYPAQRIAVVERIANAVASPELRAALEDIQARYAPARALTPAVTLVPSTAILEPSSVSVQPSMTTQSSLGPPACPLPATLAELSVGNTPARREILVRELSYLARSDSRNLAYELGLNVGQVEDLERRSESAHETVRRMLNEYFNDPCLHGGDEVGTVLRALRALHLNMTADKLMTKLYGR